MPQLACCILTAFVLRLHVVICSSYSDDVQGAVAADWLSEVLSCASAQNVEASSHGRAGNDS